MSIELDLKNNSIYLQAGIFFTAFVAIYYPFIAPMVEDWATNDNYSHGYFIPFISLYLVYEMRNELRALKAPASNWGLPIMLLGLVQLIIGKAGSEFFVQRTSMIVVLFGASLFLLGRQHTKKTWFPITYLIFMVPLPAIIWNRIAFPMQLFASAVTERAIQLMGIPIFREGN
ncbi:MAG: archaeosortase/exosortase family protein, partial [Desulfobulbaceae bacterium]|nr:archaeosortase/exosortase family protein [Desulfobulbaceae bacterium]